MVTISITIASSSCTFDELHGVQVPENWEQLEGGEEGDPWFVRQERQSSWEGLLPTAEGQHSVQIYQGYTYIRIYVYTY